MTAKKKRAAVNAWRLLMRRDARSVRRCKYWLRQYGEILTPDQLRRPQCSFGLACLATGTDPNRWNELPVTVDLGDGILVKDTPDHLREIGVIE